MNRLEVLQQLFEEDNQDPFLLFALAKEWEKAANYQQALAFYERLHTSHPGETGFYYHWGKLLEFMDKPQKALEIYDLGIANAVQQGDNHAGKELQAARLSCALLL